MGFADLKVGDKVRWSMNLRHEGVDLNARGSVLELGVKDPSCLSQQTVVVQWDDGTIITEFRYRIWKSERFPVGTKVRVKPEFYADYREYMNEINENLAVVKHVLQTYPDKEYTAVVDFVGTIPNPDYLGVGIDDHKLEAV
jgi:hypothetical protein